MATIEPAGPVVSVSWLASRLGQPGLVVLDASMKPVGGAGAGAGGGASDRASALQIPGSQVFDFDTRICDRSSPLPHMMPSPELFEAEVRALGVDRESVVVAYDRVGVYSSPRAWWMFRAMGHDRVAVLDGGLPEWIAAGQPCEPRGARPVSPGDFVAHPRSASFCDADAVQVALGDGGSVVVDARSEGRFAGREPEPRQGLRGGHMPGAINVPFTAVQENGRMRARADLAELFDAAVGPRRTLIFSCGSGVTACVLALAATIAGRTGIEVYDGSWSEWGLPSDRTVVTS